MIVSKISVDAVVEAAKKALYTGHIGDGKIFVYNVTRVVKIRTGEDDFAALQDVEYSSNILTAVPLRCRCTGTTPASVQRRDIRVCVSNESSSGAFERPNGLRKQMEGLRPDKCPLFSFFLFSDPTQKPRFCAQRSGAFDICFIGYVKVV